MTDYKVIDNFLETEQFLNIKNSILNPNFSWNLTPSVSNLRENLELTNSYYFTHLFYSGFFIDPNCGIFSDILNQLDVKSIIRIKANLYPSTNDIKYHDQHIDYSYEHCGAIFYLNTNDGFTILSDETKINSVENRILLFDPSELHSSTTCTDDKCRVNVNFNYF